MRRFLRKIGCLLRIHRGIFWVMGPEEDPIQVRQCINCYRYWFRPTSQRQWVSLSRERYRYLESLDWRIRR